MKDSLLDDQEIYTKEATLREDSNSSGTVSYWLLFRLCVLGFLVNCQPSEPFLTRYLIKDKV